MNISSDSEELLGEIREEEKKEEELPPSSVSEVSDGIIPQK